MNKYCHSGCALHDKLSGNLQAQTSSEDLSARLQRYGCLLSFCIWLIILFLFRTKSWLSGGSDDAMPSLLNKRSVKSVMTMTKD